MVESQCSAVTQDGSISCPYPATSGSDKCLFHLPPLERIQRGVSRIDYHSLIEELVQSHGVIALFNTSIGTIDLTQIDTDPLDVLTFKNVHIDSFRLPEQRVDAEVTVGDCKIGSLDGNYCTYHSEITLSGCEIEECLFRSAVFNDKVEILGCTISKVAAFGSSVFKDILLFSRPEHEIRDDHGPDWDSDLSSAADATEFRCTADFSRTTYHDFARFAGCRFECGAHFDDIEANTTLNFSGARFHHFANFKISEFYRAMDFTEAVFGYATFEECHFHGTANFSNAVFRGNELEHLTIARRLENHMASEGLSSSRVKKTAGRTRNLHLLYSPVGTDWDLNMNECTVDDSLLLKPISYLSNICLQHAEFSDLHLRAMAADDGVVGLDETTIHSGDIRFFGDSDPSISVERSTIGDVAFYGVEGVNPLENLYFGNTQFDGFGFDSHRMFLEDVGWDLMKNARGKPYSGREAERQFVNARVAARQAGDDSAAAEFFIKEKQNRRRRHLSEATDGGVISGFESVYNALTNLTLDLLCKYGESSRRLLGVGALTILAYAGVYSWIDTPTNYNLSAVTKIGVSEPILEQLSYLIFSVEVFTTFVLSSPTVSDPVVRVATASEGLAGALFVALLVFTLTKSLHR